MKRVLILITSLALAALSVAQGHGGQHFRFAGSDGGTLVQLAQRPDVQKELAVTDAEKSKLADLETRMEDAVSKDFETLMSSNEQDPNKMRTTISSTGDMFANELPNILTADQYKRLMELLIQRAGYSALERKDVQDALGFTGDQKTKVNDAQTALLKAFDSLQANDQGDVVKMKADAKAAMQTHSDALKNILTPDQATKFEAMKGKTFTFDEDQKGK